jgi:broad specificity phosphatase PhoE
MKLVIVRHGGTEWTRTGRYTGTTDLALTPKGRKQAASLAPLFEGCGRTAACLSSNRATRSDYDDRLDRFPGGGRAPR